MTDAPVTLAAVIANFNYARFLPHCVDSVLTQRPAFDEIVVVDDGSTDNSREVLAAYGGRVKIVCIRNGGQIAACRAGIDATISEYIYCLDADDFALPGLVARAHAALASRPAKLQFQLHSVDPQGAPLGSVFPIYPAAYDAAAARQDNARMGFYLCPTTSGNVFSRRALDRLDLASLDPRDAFDGSPALAMPYLGDIVSVNEPLAGYRIHGGGISGWDRPTTALLQSEIRRFEARWREVLPRIGLTAAPYGHSVPLYVREREMMIACNEARLFVFPQVARFIAAIPRTRLPAKQKTVLAAWAIALLIPSAGLRAYCLKAKRSAANRPRGLRQALNVMLGSRQTAGHG